MRKYSAIGGVGMRASCLHLASHKRRLAACVPTVAIACLMMLAGDAAAQKSRTSVSAAEVNGTFRMNFLGKFRRSSSDIKILALGRGKLRVAMDLVYPYTAGDGSLSANMGTLDGEATITGDTAVYESTEFGPCKITIKFVRPGQIKVTQDSSDTDCGFGHRVTADGTYRKVSSRKPKFSD